MNNKKNPEQIQGSTLTVAQGDLKLYWASENSITSRPGDDWKFWERCQELLIPAPVFRRTKIATGFRFLFYLFW